MNIAGVSGSQGTGAAQQVSRSEAQDSVVKSLQSRIEEIRNQMRELAKNEDLDPKSKSDKRAEMQKQISELQAQIRQRQAEMQKEKMQPTEQDKQKQAEKQAEQEAKTGTAAGFSKTGANAFLSADNAMDISKAQGSVATALTGRARELAAELISDSSRGAATEQKQEELADVTARAKKARGEQISSLGKANKDMIDAAEIDAKTKEKAEASDENRPAVHGKYDKDGRRVSEDDPEEKDFEDRA